MAPMPPGGATRKHGNAGLWAVLPVGPGTAPRSGASGAMLIEHKRRAGSTKDHRAASQSAASRHPGLKGGAPLTSVRRSVIGAGFALPRVPAPTGRTGRRSAFPGRPRGFRGWRYGPRVPAPTGSSGVVRTVAWSRRRRLAERAKKTMAANLRFAARLTGGKV